MKVSVRDRRLRRNTAPIWRTKPVTEHTVLKTSLGESLYYLCPGCYIFLPREYMRFCDCCGQRLGWDAVEKQDPWDDMDY